METGRKPWQFFGRIAAVARALAAKLRAEEPAAMIGTPPSARKISPIPADPAEHAVRFAREWADVAESYVQKRMRELGIPEHQIGAIEYAQGGVRRAFSPEETRGGTVDDFGRIFVDSGFLNPNLVDQFGPGAKQVWEKLPGKHRIDAIIAHELAEASGVGHAAALRRAADTPLPINEHARRVLKAIAEHEKRRGRA